MQLEDLLEGLGCLCSSVTNLVDGLDVAQRIGFDAAVIDLNLHGETGFPIADLLKRQGTPFIFISGYEASCIPIQYGGFR